MADSKIPRRLNIESEVPSVVNFREVSNILENLAQGPGEAAIDFSLHIRINTGRELVAIRDLERISRLRGLSLRSLLEE